MKIEKSFLELGGDRLPTEAEWVHACRVGTNGAFSFGEPEALLKEYGRHISNSNGRSHSVESLLPNDAGLFDMHGNVMEWTLDATKGSLSPVRESYLRTLHGGAYIDRPKGLRISSRWISKPGEGFFSTGFRPARTYHLSSP